MKPTPPSYFVMRFMEGHSLTCEDLAALIPCSPTLVGAILYLDHEITEMMAKKLERIFGAPASTWIEQERQYRKSLEDQDQKYLESRLDELG